MGKRTQFMRCANCGSMNEIITDTRDSGNGLSRRRRRKCLDCMHKYTTHEFKDKDLRYLLWNWLDAVKLNINRNLDTMPNIGFLIRKHRNNK